eukprot:scaffold14604_cov80-Skeletonema_dohrnii-CCMP3373.AAC.3
MWWRAETLQFDVRYIQQQAIMPVTRSKTQLKRNHEAAVAENAIPIERLTPNSEHSDNTTHNAAFFQSLSGAIQSSSASVVMLSEDKLGFTVVASESGLPESRVISNFLQNLRKLSCDEEDELWAKGLNKMYSAWAEGRDLIEWMVVCNVAQLMRGRDNFVDYCGLDIGGFYSDWTHPISMIQRYIKQHFPQFERNWSQQINPLLNALGTSKARYNYQHVLTATEKNKLALLLDELVNMMSSKRDELEGDLDAEWTRQSAISMQLAENYYRNYEHMSTDDITKKYAGLNGREIAMANNILWRLKLDCSTVRSKNEQKKMIVINHVIHTKTATQYQDEIWGHFVPMGQMVKQMLDRPNERIVATIPPPKDDGLEATMKQVSEKSGIKNFFLHWETAPSDAFVYLHSVTTIRENDYFTRAFPLEWNGCIYLDHVKHATPDDGVKYRMN